MIAKDTSVWKAYTDHVLLWEGKTSSDPHDTSAAKCVPKGMIHTNKGVTFCTFKSMAASLGITPVTHARFLKLSDQEVGLFIYDFYKKNKPEHFPDSIGLSLVESRWLSGDWSVKHLQRALKLPETGVVDTKLINAAKAVPEADLYNTYWAIRDKFFQNLKNSARFYKGWKNRMNGFHKLLGKTGGTEKKKPKPFIDAFDWLSWSRGL